VLGTHGRGGLKKLASGGSVAPGSLPRAHHRSECPASVGPG
jgi:hypothetical protein